jgi:hypothetical protein
METRWINTRVRTPFTLLNNIIYPKHHFVGFVDVRSQPDYYSKALFWSLVRQLTENSRKNKPKLRSCLSKFCVGKFHQEARNFWARIEKWLLQSGDKARDRGWGARVERVGWDQLVPMYILLATGIKTEQTRTEPSSYPIVQSRERKTKKTVTHIGFGVRRNIIGLNCCLTDSYRLKLFTVIFGLDHPSS